MNSTCKYERYRYLGLGTGMCIGGVLVLHFRWIGMYGFVWHLTESLKIPLEEEHELMRVPPHKASTIRLHSNLRRCVLDSRCRWRCKWRCKCSRHCNYDCRDISSCSDSKLSHFLYSKSGALLIYTATASVQVPDFQNGVFEFRSPTYSMSDEDLVHAWAAMDTPG